jgi:hypothetical protein
LDWIEGGRGAAKAGYIFFKKKGRRRREIGL